MGGFGACRGKLRKAFWVDYFTTPFARVASLTSWTPWKRWFCFLAAMEDRMTTATTFGASHFGGAQLGHKKRTECLIKIADCIYRHPGGTLPAKLHAPKDYKAMDRLMNRPEVTHAAVLAPHYERTLALMRQASGPVLVLHDTTEFDYSGLKSITDLGSIGNGCCRGYLCHNSLAFDPQEREVLGLVNQVLHCRERVGEHESLTSKRKRPGRESRLWLKGMTATGPAPAEHLWVHVADRGADTFEFLANLVQQQRSFLVRSCTNRRIRLGHDEEDPAGYLHIYARSLPLKGCREVVVSAGPGRAERRANVGVAYAPVVLLPPQARHGDYQSRPLPLWVVHVREIEAPAGVPPLEWMLLTDIPILNLEQAWERVSWYECRWVIEEYHKAQKTGSAIEDLQFTSSQALQPMIALLSVIAVTLLNLRDASRRADAKERPATEVVDARYVAVLSSWRHRKVRPDWSVHDFFFALARLGGHQNRKCDHRPGWLVLWRGWMALQHMLDGAEAIGFQIRGQT
jgi:hypothetical protein